MRSNKCGRLAFLLVCLPTVLGPAVAAEDLCGTTIVANLKLDQDLTCAGNGLIVGADGIKLNLDGHTITGSGSGVGISVSGRTNVSISGGVVKNFEAGVRITQSTDIVVKGDEFRGNGDGIDMQPGRRGNTVEDNGFWGNRARGSMLGPFLRHNKGHENA